MVEQHPYTNRLINEKSPYLLQHAHNPVDWYPWGEEAFKQAIAMDRPIFLSIGYATCHWCHVMEQECFENVDVAQTMNSSFVNIKVDREEHPEIDAIYMEFAQSMMSGAAGWPLNLILTPSLHPFFAATYLPPHSSHGMLGLIELLEQIHEVWNGEDRERIESQAGKIVEIFAHNIHVQGDALLDKEAIDDAAELYFKLADPIYGGIKGAPKFPVAYQINFLLHYSAWRKDSRAMFIAERSLEMMRRGGIYDHLGGGFARYSVDERWFQPHFEKMLYDNALLASAYFEAWQATKQKRYWETTEEILNYTLRVLTHPEGGFYSAEDADSEGNEGLFYTWRLEEVQNILGKKEAVHFCEYYDITEEGNFHGRNIMHEPLTLNEFATAKGLNPVDLELLFKIQGQVLAKVREQRVHPFKDDKILTAWNGLMIYAMAQAVNCAAEDNFLMAAQRAARFIKNHLWRDGFLLRRWRDGEGSFEAGLEDYAFLIRGLLALFDAGLGTEWLQWALQLNAILKSDFKSEGGAYYQIRSADENVILRKCLFTDGAEPSGNAVQCENLLKLYQITSEEQYLQDAEDIIKAVAEPLDNYSPGYCFHLMNIGRYYDKQAPLIVIALNSSNEHQRVLFELLHCHFIAHKSVVWLGENDQLLQQMVPLSQEYVPLNGQTTLYICYQGVCQKPLTILSEIQDAILAC